jgi:hypothetical protein
MTADTFCGVPQLVFKHQARSKARQGIMLREMTKPLFAFAELNCLHLHPLSRITTQLSTQSVTVSARPSKIRA